MIDISVRRNNCTCSVVIDGHAGYAQSGYDIICAAVSTLYLHLINSIESFTGADGRESVQDDTRTYFIAGMDHEARLLVDAFRNSCESIAKENPEYVRYIDV